MAKPPRNLPYVNVGTKGHIDHNQKRRALFLVYIDEMSEFTPDQSVFIESLLKNRSK